MKRDTLQISNDYLFFVSRALSSIQDKMRPTFDISVQFFGLDWPHIFRISSNLVGQVSGIRETLKENGGDISKEISVILPRLILGPRSVSRFGGSGFFLEVQKRF